MSDSNYYTSHEPGLLFSNHTFKQQTGVKKILSDLFQELPEIYGQDLAAAQSEMRRRHPDLRETDLNP